MIFFEGGLPIMSGDVPESFVLPQKRFSRNIENFTCEHCGNEVCGNGFTNHCPSCLWSKHVDVYPGDRSHKCQGLMEPIGTETKRGRHIILHQCIVCGLKRKNKLADNDNYETLLQIVRERS